MIPMTDIAWKLVEWQALLRASRRRYPTPRRTHSQEARQLPPRQRLDTVRGDSRQIATASAEAKSQSTMLKTKLPSSRLALSFVFDMPGEIHNSSSADHEAAAREAARQTGLVQPSFVAAKSSILNNLTLQSVHHSPFDPDFHVADGGPAVRFEFFYDHDVHRMGLRVVTSLGEEKTNIVDGVTACRLAFHTMEILEGKAPNKDSPANRAGKIPPFEYGWRHRLNFMREILPGTLFRVAGAYVSMFVDWVLGTPPPSDPTLVNDAKSMFQFYSSSHASDPAMVQVFRQDASLKPFRLFSSLVDRFHKARGLKQYFYLNNFSPLVAAGVCKHIGDIASVKTRYENIFDPPDACPAPRKWIIANPQQARNLIFNNYGVHKHNFSAKPVAYIWDWLELAAPIHGAGCMTINDTFLCWVRGTPSALKACPVREGFGDPVAQLPQNDSWFATMGRPASIAPKTKLSDRTLKVAQAG